MFSLDRDLLVLEPSLFRDLAWAGQRLLDAPASISGSTLTVPGVDLAARSIGPGSVVRCEGLSLEVLAIPSTSAATVSLLRGADGDAAIVPAPAASTSALVFTFAPQRAAAHAELLAALGLAPDGAEPGPGRYAVGSVLNPRSLARLECFLALASIFTSAAALAPATPAALERAALYRRRASAEAARAAAHIDTDGDGFADVSRRVTSGALTRV